MGKSLNATQNIIGLMALVGLVLFGFNNCTNVNFSVDKDGVVDLLSQNSALVINDNDNYTLSKNVILSIGSDGADEMMISNDPQQETEWEAYSTQKNWVLGQENGVARVYIKFRSRGIENQGWINDGIIHDNTAPAISVNSRPNNYTNNSSSAVEYSIYERGSDIQMNECGRDASLSFENCGGDRLELVAQNFNHSSDGTFQHFIRSKDKAGNLSQTTSVIWVVDRVPPTVFLSGQLPELTGATTISIGFHGEDDRSGISHFLCKWQGENFKDCSSPYERNSLTDGSYSFEVQSVDRAGNISSAVRHQWEVHTSAPTITFVAPLPLANSNATSAQIGFVGKDKDFTMTSFQCRLNGGSFQNCTSPYSMSNLQDGQQTLSVRGRDRLGQFSVAFPYTWNVDTKINNISFTKKPKAYSSDTTGFFTLGGLDADVDKVYCQLNEEAYKLCPGKSSFSLTGLMNRDHTLKVYAQDKIGNRSNVISYTWTVDLEAPVVTIAGPDAIIRSGLSNFVFTATDNATATNLLTYECKIDNQSYQSCSKNQSYTVSAGPHSLLVRVTDKAGNSGVSNIYRWTVDLSNTQIIVKQQPESVIYQDEKAIVLFEVVDNGFPIESLSCQLDGLNKTCASNVSLDLGALSVGDHIFSIRVVSDLGSIINKNISFEVKEVGNCTGEDNVCLVLRDDFERENLQSGEFGWSLFVDDIGRNENGLIVSINDHGEASSGEKAVFFTGRPGGSVHSLNLISKAFDLSEYDRITVEFDYLMASFEGWSYGGQSGREYIHFDLCTEGESQCASQLKNSSVWVNHFEDTATSDINQHMTGYNHTRSDFVSRRDNNKITIDLTNSSIDRSKLMMRWSVKIDEGLEYNAPGNADAGIVDNIVVKAYKN